MAIYFFFGLSTRPFEVIAISVAKCIVPYLVSEILKVVIAGCFRVKSTQGACFWRAAWTPRGKCTLIFVFPTPRYSRTPLMVRGPRAQHENDVI